MHVGILWLVYSCEKGEFDRFFNQLRLILVARKKNWTSFSTGLTGRKKVLRALSQVGYNRKPNFALSYFGIYFDEPVEKCRRVLAAEKRCFRPL